MHRPNLPAPHPGAPLAFGDLPSAKTWLAAQPQAQPMHMLAALCQQVEAIDAAELPAPLAIELLNLLRSQAVPLIRNVENRFIRKPLPLPDEDFRCFDLVRRLWQQFGIAYLRRAAAESPQARALCLHRAATAFRLAQFAHFQAAYQCAGTLDDLLLDVISMAENDDMLQQGQQDPDFPHHDPGHIAGQVAWAFLLRTISPCQFSAAQLQVVNRALRRWRELTSFQLRPDTDCVDLTRLPVSEYPKTLPQWLNIRKFLRKIRQRIDALAAGESPDSLKLGRELSGAACIRLLQQLDATLSRRHVESLLPDGELQLVFGAENAHALFTGEHLNPISKASSSSAIAHQRMAIFGFDHHSSLPGAKKTLDLPTEVWQLAAGRARRTREAGSRRLSPCLVARQEGKLPQLGIMLALTSDDTGNLSASIRWLPGQIESGHIAPAAPPPPASTPPKIPVFVLRSGTERSLLIPASVIVRLNEPMQLKGLSTPALTPTQVLERGTDFALYAVGEQ